VLKEAEIDVQQVLEVTKVYHANDFYNKSYVLEEDVQLFEYAQIGW